METHPDRMPRPKHLPPPTDGGYMALGMRTWEATGQRDPLDGLDREALRLLWDNARAELLRTVNPATAALIGRGSASKWRRRCGRWRGKPPLGREPKTPIFGVISERREWDESR